MGYFLWNLKMTIKERLTADMKSAMRAREIGRLRFIRFIIAAINRKEIDQRRQLNTQETILILEKLIKQHHDSIKQYEKAERNELAEKERFELKIIQSYMPKQLSEKELDTLIQEAIKQNKATSTRDMGKVMLYLKSLIQGRADMLNVSKKVKCILNKSK